MYKGKVVSSTTKPWRRDVKTEENVADSVDKTVSGNAPV